MSFETGFAAIKDKVTRWMDQWADKIVWPANGAAPQSKEDYIARALQVGAIRLVNPGKETVEVPIKDLQQILEFAAYALTQVSWHATDQEAYKALKALVEASESDE